MGEKEMLVHKPHNTDATYATSFLGGVEVLNQKRFALLSSPFFHFVAALCYKFCTRQSRNPTNSQQTKTPHIDSCLKPLYNGHLFTMSTFFCPVERFNCNSSGNACYSGHLSKAKL